MNINSPSYTFPGVNFEALKFKTCNDIKLPEKFSIDLSAGINNVDCFVSSVANKDDVEFKVVDKNFKELGHSCFSRDKNDIQVISINNFSNLKGIGSILHLSRIITMLENNFDKIRLYSLGNAMTFHSKFMFKSDVNNRGELVDFIVQEIILKTKNNEKFASIIESAKQWFTKNNVTNNEKIAEGNLIIDDYLKVVNQQKNDECPDIISGVDMVLSRETVLQYKKYFNNLLSRYGIDYQIV